MGGAGRVELCSQYEFRHKGIFSKLSGGRRCDWHTVCFTHFHSLASFSGVPTMDEEHVVSTVHTHTAPQAFLVNLETSVVLVRVSEPYITESRE